MPHLLLFIPDEMYSEMEGNIYPENTLEYIIGKSWDFNEVKTNIRKYFSESQGLNDFEVIDVRKSSDHPDDSYLFHVIGLNKQTKEYAVWTSWNKTMKSLNHGHYNLTSFEEAEKVCEKFYNRIEENGNNENCRTYNRAE